MSWWKTCCCRWLGTDSETPPTDSGGNERGQHNQNIWRIQSLHLESQKPLCGIGTLKTWLLFQWVHDFHVPQKKDAWGTQWKSSHTTRDMANRKANQMKSERSLQAASELGRRYTNSHALTTVLFECCVYLWNCVTSDKLVRSACPTPRLGHVVSSKLHPQEVVAMGTKVCHDDQMQLILTAHAVMLNWYWKPCHCLSVLGRGQKTLCTHAYTCTHTHTQCSVVVVADLANGTRTVFPSSNRVIS